MGISVGEARALQRSCGEEAVAAGDWAALGAEAAREGGAEERGEQEGVQEEETHPSSS